MNDLKARVSILTPQAGDTLAITTPWPMTDQQKAEYQAYAESKVPAGVNVLILCGGSTLMHIQKPEGTV